MMIHNHQQALGSNQLQSFVLWHYNIKIFCFVIRKNDILVLQHLAYAIVILVTGAGHNIGFLVQGKAQLSHTHSSANSIIILVVMTHNKDSISLLHLLMNGLRHNTRPHASTLCRYRRGTTKELGIFIL